MKDPEDYVRDRAEKYVQYFQGNRIMSILEVSKALEPRTQFFVIVDGIPCQYYNRRSYVKWDILLPTKEQATKLNEKNIMTKNFRM